jgi:hypothetical protein
MDDNKRIRLISSIDLIVSSLLIIGGFIFIIIWSRSSEIVQVFIQLDKVGLGIPIELIEFSTFLLLLIGIFFLVYGSERLINNILKIHISKKKSVSNNLQDQMTGYRRYPPV